MKHCIFILVLLWTSPGALRADSLENLYQASLHEQADLLKTYYRSAVPVQDSQTIVGVLMEIETTARQRRQLPLALLASSYRARYWICKQNVADGLSLHKQILAQVLQQRLPALEVVLRCHYAEGLYGSGEYDLAFEVLLPGLNLADRIGIERVVDPVKCLFIAGELYFAFSNYAMAAQYYCRATDFAHRDSLIEVNSYNKYGACLALNGEVEGAEEAYLAGVEIASAYKDSINCLAIQTNLARLYLMQKKWDEAELAFQAIYALSDQFPALNLQVSSLLSLTEIDLHRGHLDSIPWKIQELRSRLFHVSDPMNALAGWVEYHWMVSQYYEKTGNFAAAAHHKDSTIAIQDSMDMLKDITGKGNLHAKFLARQHEADLLDIQAHQRDLVLRHRVTTALSTLFALGLGIFFVGFARKRRKERLRSFGEAETAQRKFEAYRREAKLRDAGMKSLELKSKRTEPELPWRTVHGELADQLSKMTILTEEDWLEFKRNFRKLHPGFFDSLRSQHRDLTEAEVRLLALLKLGLSVSEIARVLGILPQSVRKTRSRLMKKLSIGDHKELVHMASTI